MENRKARLPPPNTIVGIVELGASARGVASRYIYGQFRGAILFFEPLLPTGLRILRF